MSHPELTERQVREVNVALRHLGRAMKALERASLPDPVPFQGWLHSLHDGAVSVAHASDELIDGLETLAQWGSEPLPPWHEAHEPSVCEARCRHRCPECRMGLGKHLTCDPLCEARDPKPSEQ